MSVFICVNMGEGNFLEEYTENEQWLSEENEQYINYVL